MEYCAWRSVRSSASGCARACLSLPSARQGASRQLRLLSPPLLKHISWSILPLVAGLFVLVKGVVETGALSALPGFVAAKAATAPLATAFGTGILVALAGNLVNNLPMGLFAGAAGASAHWPPAVKAAVLIGVDLGPNLSVTGSLATLLWLIAIRREGENVSGWRFLALGALVMPPALLAALALAAH
jgi:arsenical pump membrane protein